MKVLLVTIVDNINFGTILQAFALSQKIKDLGMEVEVIDYQRPNSTTYTQIKGIIANHNRSPINRIIYSTCALVLVPFIKHRLRRFLKDKITVTQRFTSYQSLCSADLKADVYMTGSDQVWNTQYNDGVDKVFYLDFTSGKKVSYASSIGMDFYNSDEISEILPLLHKYSALSLRESKSCRYLEMFGIKDIFHAIDPTLLLNKEEWSKMFKPKLKLPEQYLLVYSVEGRNNDYIFQQASFIAKYKKMPLYVVSASDPIKLRKYRCDKIYAFANCETFLELMYNASFIVASSFHGTAFAINFQKEFITITPDKYNIRMEDLIGTLNLSSRVININQPLSMPLQHIDFTKVNKQIEAWRFKSLSYLSSALKS